jgi:hypothetical protein
MKQEKPLAASGAVTVKFQARSIPRDATIHEGFDTVVEARIACLRTQRSA